MSTKEVQEQKETVEADGHERFPDDFGHEDVAHREGAILIFVVHFYNPPFSQPSVLFNIVRVT